MGIDVLAYLLEFVLGPLFLLVHIPKIPAVVGEVGQFGAVLAGEDPMAAVDAVLAGEFDRAAKTAASLAGTIVWVGIAATVGELGEAGELLELFG